MNVKKSRVANPTDEVVDYTNNELLVHIASTLNHQSALLEEIRDLLKEAVQKRPENF